MAEEKKYTIDQLTAIVKAGMSLTEAKALLREGYSPEDVLELAHVQAATAHDQAVAVQTAAGQAIEKAIKPHQNRQHPAISAFSYPEGDIAHPKATMPYEFFYNGYPCTTFPDTQHWREMELMAQVKPGDYTVVRKDHSIMAVHVKGERDANNALTKVSVEFPVSREEKWLVPAMPVVLYQLVYSDNPRKRFLEAMHEHLTMMIPDTVGA